MTLIARASKLLKANINHLLDAAEDPEVMVKELIRDMDAAVAELRRETVNAVAREKQLARKADEAGLLAAELENRAGLALDGGDEALARRILADRVEALKEHEALAAELREAAALARTVKTDLRRMQRQAETARRKKDELIRRKRSAEARLSSRKAARRSAEAVGAAGAGAGGFAAGAALEGYADSIRDMEARAEADRELADSESGAAERLDALVRDSDIDGELERLKKQRAAHA